MIGVLSPSLDAADYARSTAMVKPFNAGRLYGLGLKVAICNILIAHRLGCWSAVLLSPPLHPPHPQFRIMTSILVLFLVASYCMYWSAKTLSFDRRIRVFPALILGSLWTLCTPLAILNINFGLAKLMGWGGVKLWVVAFLVSYALVHFFQHGWALAMPAHDSAKYFR